MKKSILIVDRSSLSRLFIALTLRQAGYCVDEAESTDKALLLSLKAEARGKRYDVLVMDIQLPHMTNIDLLYELEREHIFMPVLAIAPFTTAPLLRELEGYCSDILIKPFGDRELIGKIKAMLQRREQADRALSEMGCQCMLPLPVC